MLLLLILALLAPAPLAVTALHTEQGVTVSWRPPPGQARAHILRVGDVTDELLAYPEGRVGLLHIPRSPGEGLRVPVGGRLLVRAYSADGRVLAQGYATAQAPAARLWLPRVN